MGIQNEIDDTIAESVLALKENQPTLYNDEEVLIKTKKNLEMMKFIIKLWRRIMAELKKENIIWLKIFLG